MPRYPQAALPVPTPSTPRANKSRSGSEDKADQTTLRDPAPTRDAEGTLSRMLSPHGGSKPHRAEELTDPGREKQPASSPSPAARRRKRREQRGSACTIPLYVMLGHPWETPILWGAMKPHLWVSRPTGRDAGPSHASPVLSCPNALTTHSTTLTHAAAETPNPGGFCIQPRPPAGLFGAGCPVFRPRDLHQSWTAPKKAWNAGHGAMHRATRVPPGSRCAPGAPRLPHGPPPALGTSPMGVLGGAAGPSVTSSSSRGSFEGPPWSKANQPLLTRCVPPRSPAGLCWLLERGRASCALQTPWQRQQTLGRCISGQPLEMGRAG